MSVLLNTFRNARYPVRAFLYVCWIGISFSGFTLKAKACFCSAPPTLCESMNPSESPADIGVLGVKLEQVYYGMRFLVLNAVYGAVLPGDTITVWGSYDLGGGGACRVGTDLWEVGDTIFAGFHVSDLAGNIFPGWPPDLEQPGSYMTHLCGTFYLGFEQGAVVGPIAPGVIESSVSDMAQYFSGCPTSVDGVSDLAHLPTFLIGPTTEAFVVPDRLHVQPPFLLLDLTGAVIARPTLSSNLLRIPDLPSGQYILVSIADRPDRISVRLQHLR